MIINYNMATLETSSEDEDLEDLIDWLIDDWLIDYIWYSYRYLEDIKVL